MSLVFKTIQTEGIVELSYLLGDDDEGVGAVFDPRHDVEVYVDLAREAKVSITHIFETHIHADLMSGSRELCARLESAKIYASHEGGASYGFEHEKLKDGDEFTFGELLVTARHTPGHTPEHLSYLKVNSDRKSTRLNSSHLGISYAVFCLKKTTYGIGAERCKGVGITSSDIGC